MGVTAQDRFYIENFNIEPGETKIVEIQLDNVTTFSAIQADIFLPEGLTTFNCATFNGCKNLHKVVLPKSFKNFKGLGGDFNKCGEIAIYFPAEVELESWTSDKGNKGLTNMPINTFKNITIYIVKGSWMDEHFEELYDDASSATKLAKKNGEKRKDIPPVAYWEG